MYYSKQIFKIGDINWTNHYKKKKMIIPVFEVTPRFLDTPFPDIPFA
jgi:hypothetical protein